MRFTLQVGNIVGFFFSPDICLYVTWTESSSIAATRSAGAADAGDGEQEVLVRSGRQLVLRTRATKEFKNGDRGGDALRN